MTETGAGGFVTAFSAGAPLPTASNLNVIEAGQTVAAQVTVHVGLAQPDVSLFTYADTHLIADIEGVYTA